MIKEGADSKVSGHFKNAVAQVVLLFGKDKCELTPWVEKALDIFQYRFARRLTGRPTIFGGNGGVRLLGDKKITHEEEEHGRTVYYNMTKSGPL